MSDGYPSQCGLADSVNPGNALAFLVRQMLGKVHTVTLVQVKAVTGIGVNPVGTVDVMPLVALVDGLLQSPLQNGGHATIYNVPYMRIQGGTNAIICDPEVNDIGICLFADRDISSVKRAKAAALPASHRRFDWADGLYLGGVLNAAPVNYLKVDDTGFNLTDKFGNSIVSNSSGIVITDCNGNSMKMASSGSELTLNGHTLTRHQHSQGVDSHGDTEANVNTPFN